MSFGEYLLLKLSGRAVASISMVSGSGLWNQNENDYDSGILSVLPIDRNQLASVQEMDEPLLELCAGYRSRWPEFAGAQWYPALGDGACNNVGSGCHAADRFALMVGTSGAMRVVLEARRMEIPEGLWCYRVDRKRFILGGALSNGGLVFEWIKRTLLLPDDEEIEKELAAMMPGSHGLTFLPLFAGERSTKWRAEARAAITGISMNTRPIEIGRWRSLRTTRAQPSLPSMPAETQFRPLAARRRVTRACRMSRPATVCPSRLSLQAAPSCTRPPGHR